MKKILVIDDNTEIRENIAEILSLSNYLVSTASNGKEGVAIALKEIPDLIVCDIMMPELDGYGVLHLLKKNLSTEQIPFIFLTAKTERVDFRKGMELGADDYVTKPFDDLELLKAIEIRLKKIHLIQDTYSQDKKGATSFIRNLGDSGFPDLSPDNYEADIIMKKQVIYKEGKHPRYLYYVKSGKIKTYKLHDNGKEYITTLLIPGDYFGYLPIIEHSVYDDNAEALEDSEIVQINREDFLTALFNDISIATKFVSLIGKDVKHKEDRLLNLAYDSLRKRVARGLLEMHAKLTNDSQKPSIDLCREDIAQYVGAATESLIRTLSDFKSEGLIEIKEGKILINEPAKLADLIA